MLNRSPNAIFQSVKVVGRILTGKMMVVAVKQHALVAAGVIHYRASKFRAVRTVHDHRANRIGAIINTKGGMHSKHKYLRQFALVKR